MRLPVLPLLSWLRLAFEPYHLSFRPRPPLPANPRGAFVQRATPPTSRSTTSLRDSTGPATVTGYAFGMGLDRLAMIQYGIKDIRLLIENDTRFFGTVCLT